MMDLFAWKPKPDATVEQVAASWEALSDGTDAALKAFIQAAQADMHLGPWWKRWFP
jgi:hypothetical protein